MIPLIVGVVDRAYGSMNNLSSCLTKTDRFSVAVRSQWMRSKECLIRLVARPIVSLTLGPCVDLILLKLASKSVHGKDMCSVFFVLDWVPNVWIKHEATVQNRGRFRIFVSRTHDGHGWIIRRIRRSQTLRYNVVPVLGNEEVDESPQCRMSSAGVWSNLLWIGMKIHSIKCYPVVKVWWKRALNVDTNWTQLQAINPKSMRLDYERIVPRLACLVARHSTIRRSVSAQDKCSCSLVQCHSVHLLHFNVRLILGNNIELHPLLGNDNSTVLDIFVIFIQGVDYLSRRIVRRTGPIRFSHDTSYHGCRRYTRS